MTDWYKHYNTFPATYEKNEFFEQVGKTFKGLKIDDEHFRLILSAVKCNLKLAKTDIVLDLCCGNGLITNEISKNCKKVVGIDYSKPLIEVARKYHNPNNASYYLQSVLDLDNSIINTDEPFNKIIMYEALQHFRKNDLLPLLKSIKCLSTTDAIIYFASIPNIKDKWKFYNTPKRKLLYFLRRLYNKEVIGTWWDGDFIRDVCSKIEMNCNMLPQHNKLYTSNYRFDALITHNIYNNTIH